jgi:hypothetical protein
MMLSFCVADLFYARDRKACALRLGFHLRNAAIHPQFDSGNEAAVIGG